MDIYITEKNSGVGIALSMLPEQVYDNGEAVFQDFNIINVGEVKLHGGNKLKTFSWSGKFPKEQVKNMSFVKSWHWQSPTSLEKIISSWREEGTVLNLMVTETAINCDVMVSEFNVTLQGKLYDDYEIEFIEHKELRVYTVAEMNTRKNASKSSTTRSVSNNAYSRESAISYTVKAVVPLWDVD